MKLKFAFLGLSAAAMLSACGSSIDTDATIEDTELAQDIYEEVGPAVQEKLQGIGTSIGAAPSYTPSAEVSESVDIDETFEIDGTSFVVQGSSSIEVNGDTTTIDQELTVEWTGLEVEVDGTSYNTDGIIEYDNQLKSTVNTSGLGSIEDSIDVDLFETDAGSDSESIDDALGDIEIAFSFNGTISEKGQITVDGQGTFGFENTTKIDESGVVVEGTLNGESYTGDDGSSSDDSTQEENGDSAGDGQ